MKYTIDVEVLQDLEKGVTIVQVFDPIYGLATGASKCTAPDVFDSETGEQIAFGRALRKMGRRTLNRAYREVHKKDKARQKQEQALKEKKTLKNKKKKTPKNKEGK